MPSRPSPLLLILGAGASRPYGFPTAGQLRSIILGGAAGTRALHDLGVSWNSILNFLVGKKTLAQNQALARAITERWEDGSIPLDLPIAEVLLDAAFEVNGISPRLVSSFREEFFKSQRVSIDAFANTWDDFSHVARLAIATVILFCERADRLEGDWYQQLLEAIVRNEGDFKGAGLRIITFNYDRSLDWYLHRALVSFCKNDYKELERWKERIEIIHVYGMIGDLWPGSHYEAIKYGDISKIVEAASNLRLARGGTHKTHDHISDLVKGAKRIAFLGFGFWRENVELLSILSDPHPEIFASAMGLSRTVQLDIERSLPPITFGKSNQTVLDFVQHEPIFRFV